MSETLRWLADNAKKLAESHFVEVDRQEKFDWVVTRPPGPLYFRFKDPDCHSVEYSWMALEEWKHYERAIFYGESGDIEGVVLCMLKAKELEVQYLVDLHKVREHRRIHGGRLKGAEMAKVRRKGKRIRRAIELVENKTVPSFWKASFKIAKEEHKSPQTVWKSIRHLNQQKRG